MKNIESLYKNRLQSQVLDSTQGGFKWKNLVKSAIGGIIGGIVGSEIPDLIKKFQ